MTSSNTCYVVVNGYHGDDGYIDGTVRIFSTRQKAEEFIKKLEEEMKKRKRPGEQFSDYYNQTIMEIEIEWLPKTKDMYVIGIIATATVLCVCLTRCLVIDSP